MMEKIIRSVCIFSSDIDAEMLAEKHSQIETKLLQYGYSIQTQRVCFANAEINQIERAYQNTESDFILSAGSLDRASANEQSDAFIESNLPIAINLHIDDQVKEEDVSLLFKIIKQNASKTFHFTYSFNNVLNSPFFPAANFGQNGFSIGLQPTNLSAGCKSLQQWFDNMSGVWNELTDLFIKEDSFLGIDSSVAPLFGGVGSFIHFVQKFYPDFAAACTSDVFTQVSGFIKTKNPKPAGLCGLMFPCLEDFELADLYSSGNFSIERNIFLSLHSGLGIDTYPVGINENPERVLSILQLLLSLSKKYNKPLAARFVSDGKAKIGERTNFENQYLKDIVVRPL